MTVRLAVLGIGQQMRHDDAVGLEAVRLWQRTHASTAQLPEIAVSLVEEPGLELLGLLEGMGGAVIVDAVRSGSAAGTLHHIEVEDLSAYSEAVASAHNWGVAEVLRLGGTQGLNSRLPQIRLIGIEASQTGFGEGLSPAVQSALPAIAMELEAAVGELLQA